MSAAKISNGLLEMMYMLNSSHRGVDALIRAMAMKVRGSTETWTCAQLARSLGAKRLGRACPALCRQRRWPRSSAQRTRHGSRSKQRRSLQRMDCPPTLVSARLGATAEIGLCSGLTLDT